jgi:N-acetylglucosaminyldiphosphoundecaprenol N-acetyl-beta-D-mannosaminyltransferase
MNPTPYRIRIAGCPVDNYSMGGTIAELCRRIDSRIRTHVVFVNAAKVVQYHQNPALRDVVERADLLLPDGVPILWLSYFKGTPLSGRVAGVDLMERMVGVAERRGYRVFFLGASADIVQKTVEIFQQRYPHLLVAGFHDGYFSLGEEETITDKINQSHADLLLVGMSTPQKELWVDRNLAKLKVSVCEGVGGGFDVVAGLTKRAPLWMQRAGLEWFYRLLQEPGRMWKRYVLWNSSFLLLAFSDLYKGTRKADGKPAPSYPGTRS